MEPTVYLFFKGNCLEAMTHYAETLGGEITGVFRNGDVEDPNLRMPGGDDMMMNMAMKLGSSMIMASDNSEDMYDKPQGFYVQIAPESREEFDRIYARLSVDAENIAMKPAETFWANRSAPRDGIDRRPGCRKGFPVLMRMGKIDLAALEAAKSWGA